MIAFTASDDWIQALLEQANELSFTQSREVAHAQQCFQIFLQLFHHGSVLSERIYLREVALLPDRNRCASQVITLKQWAVSTSVDDFMTRGAKVTRFPASLRSGAMRIVTDNVFSADFYPPPATRAKLALKTLLKRSGPQLANQWGEQNVIGVALASYFIFLTIHPFNDGNGRTARFFFAACICGLTNQSPFLLLALAMMYRDRGAPFHMAAKIARLGDLTALAEIYQEGLALASSLFGAEVDAISRAPSLAVVEGSDQMAALLSLHGRLKSCLFF